MKITKLYYTLDDVSSITKISKSDLIHMGVTGQLGIHALAADWLVDLFGMDVTEDTNGQENLVEFKISITPERIRGPVKLHKETLALLEANPKARIDKFVAHIPGYVDDVYDFYEYRLSTESIQIADVAKDEPSSCKLVVINNEFEKLITNEDQTCDKPIHTKTLNGMNQVIAALAQKLNIDMSAPHPAANTIETYVSEIGGSVKSSTIASYLKKIPPELKVIKKK